MSTEKTVILNVDLFNNGARLVANATNDQKLELVLQSKLGNMVISTEQASLLLAMRQANRG